MTLITLAIQAVPTRLAMTGKSTKRQEKDLFDRALITHNRLGEEESRGSLLENLCC